MKRMMYIAAFLMFISCGATRVAKTETTEVTDRVSGIRVASYNLWRSDLGKGEYSWENRKNRLVESIIDIDFDIAGVQEADFRIQEELPLLVEKAGANYGWWFFSPYSQDGKGDRAQGVVYRKDRFEIVDSHWFWLSGTPEVMSSGWDEKKFKRGACCLTVKDKPSGECFVFVVSHMPLGKEAKNNSAQLIIDYAVKYNRDNLPCFFVGDLNARPDTLPSEIFRTYWSDSFLYLPASCKHGSEGTFNSHNIVKDMSKANRIDYVYFRGDGVTPLSYVCHNKVYGGIYPSDHCAVYVDFQIKF